MEDAPYVSKHIWTLRKIFTLKGKHARFCTRCGSSVNTMDDLWRLKDCDNAIETGCTIATPFSETSSGEEE